MTTSSSSSLLLPEHEVCALFPPMSDDEFAALKADIAAHGLRESVWTYQGQIVDGRHRYRACAELGITPKTREYTGDADSVLDFVVSLNLHRRHLTREQRQELVGRLRTEGWSLPKIAAATGTSVGTAWNDAQAFSAESLPERVIGSDGKTYPAHLPRPTAGPVDDGGGGQGEGRGEPLALIEIEAGLDKVTLTLPVWKALTPEQQTQALARPRNPKFRFNEQKSTDIEWAMWSWNPVTGCKHNCSYCYARDIAEKSPNYPQKFVPTFLPERLDAPRTMKVPDRAARELGYRNVFTCSMADLFGGWVPPEWIEAVLDVVRATPQWNFLFLTKFPIRLQEFDFPANAWVGTSVDAQERVTNAEAAMAKVNAKVKWLSCEPLLEPLKFTRLDLFDWIVIGGASASTETPEWRPPFAWIVDLYQQARAAKCRVYFKTNLYDDTNRLREYPGQPEPEPINVADAFKMGYLQRDVLEPEAYAREHDSGQDEQAAG